VYTLSDYLWMVADDARVAAYAAALKALIRPGVRVLEVGAGFGFFSVLAARAGAGHIDAVETNPVVHLGPKIAAANGCADRMTFHHCNVAQLTLDTPADVLLIDVRGPTPFGRRSLEVVIDARDRLLAPGGLIIAARDRVFVAPTRTPQVFRREVHAAHGQQGVDLDPVERIVYDTPMRCAVTADDLLAEGKPWIELEYRTIADTDGTGTVEWIFERAGDVEGLAAWFETDLGAGIRFSTAPSGDVQIYRQMFIPFRSPVTVCAGDRFRVQLAARQARESYLWEWRIWITLSGSPEERLVVDQNSLAEIVLDPSALPATSSEIKPALGVRGAALLRLLSRMDGDHSLAALTEAAAAEAPEQFPTDRAAAEFVSQWIATTARLERGSD
jgi:type I protein arginine methyltransferase